jgi:hypothetical protein
MPLPTRSSASAKFLNTRLRPTLKYENQIHGRRQDNYGARFVCVRGHDKVFCHLMFGIIALTAERLMGLVAA